MYIRNLLVISLAVLFVGCAGDGPPPSHTQETFHEVVGTPGNLRTGFRLRQAPAGNPWTFFHHEGRPDGDCYDLAVDPNGLNRFVSYVHRDEDQNWQLQVYSALGPSIWSQEPDVLDLPPIEPPSNCARTRIEHLTGDLFGIVWVGNGVLNTAVYDSSATPPFSITLGETFSHTDFEPTDDIFRPSTRNVSLAYFGDGIRIVWSPGDHSQIRMVRGQLNGAQINMESASTFFNEPHDVISDVLTADGEFFVATSDDDGVTLWERSTSVNWQQYAFCEDRRLSHGKLLYKNMEGDIEVIATSGLLNMSTCQTTSFPLPIVSGVISYHPGG